MHFQDIYPGLTEHPLFTAKQAKLLTNKTRNSPELKDEASLALLLVDIAFDDIKAAANKGKGYTLFPVYENSPKAIEIAEDFLRKECGYVIDNQNGVRTIYWFI
ncbi:hypothetical protein GFV85_14440 [Salmonella enterica]|nr:hypothetical protein [Salmonella enterica]EDK0423901.1 hypothetical protein [Salmonella enterica]EGI8464642.1 hypothetical protein [Salmonella enterica]